MIDESKTKHGFLPRCEGCAFNPQTDANRSDVTRLKARLCVEALEPFFCHEQVQEAVNNGLPYSQAIEQVEMPLCSGWCEAVATRNDSGFYESQEEWRRAVLRGCLEYIVQVEDGFDPGETLFPPALFDAVQKELARVAD